MPGPIAETQRATDGYPIHVAVWPAAGTLRGRVVVLHGVQSHGGWYPALGATLAGAGFEVHMPDRRGSGANRQDRGHAPSARRLLDDLAESLADLRGRSPSAPVAVAGISWGGKLALIAAADRPDLVDALALICPGLHPRVGVPLAEKMRIAWAFLRDRRRTFPIPLADPALFTDDPAGRDFIAADRLGLHAATAGLMVASTVIDGMARRRPGRVRQPALLMLAGLDRIVDNDRTRRFFRRLAGLETALIEYPGGHHTLEFEPDPTLYARDLAAWLAEALPPNGA